MIKIKGSAKICFDIEVDTDNDSIAFAEIKKQLCSMHQNVSVLEDDYIIYNITRSPKE